MYGVWMLDVLLTFVTIITVYAWLYAWRSGKHGSCHAECQGSTPGQVTHFFTRGTTLPRSEIWRQLVGSLSGGIEQYKLYCTVF